MNIQAHFYPVTSDQIVVDRFEELCRVAVLEGLRDISEEEFEREFAVRLDDSLQQFVGRAICPKTKNDIVVYLVRASHGLIGSNEAISISNKIFYQNTQFMENNRLQ